MNETKSSIARATKNKWAIDDGVDYVCCIKSNIPQPVLASRSSPN